MFKDAILVRQHDNGTVAPSGDEGLLYVKIVNKQTGEKKRGTVCDYYYFNMQATRLFCQNMGYPVKEGVFGSQSSYEYVPE